MTLDFGVAVHPQDGDQKRRNAMGLADKRLYELKQSGRVSSRVIPLESQPAREREPQPAREREPQPTREPQPIRESAPPAAAPCSSAAPAECRACCAGSQCGSAARST